MNKIQIAASFLKTASTTLTAGFTVLSVSAPELDNKVVYTDALGEEKELEVGTFLSARTLRNLEADLASLEDFSGIVVRIVSL